MCSFVSMPKESEKLRIDKYLWAIRIFKTRSLATEACKAGKVKLNGQNVKPSYLVKVDEIFHVQKGVEKKVVKALALLDKRVDAKTAVLHYEDLTPVEDTYRYKSMFNTPVLKRERGSGRPTKRERREIDDLQSEWFVDDNE